MSNVAQLDQHVLAEFLSNIRESPGGAFDIECTVLVIHPSLFLGILESLSSVNAPIMNRSAAARWRICTQNPLLI